MERTVRAINTSYHLAEASGRELDTIAELMGVQGLCPRCGTAYHGTRTVVVDKAGHSCSGVDFVIEGYDVPVAIPYVPAYYTELRNWI